MASSTDAATAFASTQLSRHAADVLAFIPARRPLVIAFDGPSGGGKSAIAESVAAAAPEPCARVSLDDFFTTREAEADLHGLPHPEKLGRMFEWDRARDESLVPLRVGHAAAWRPFDYLAGRDASGLWRLQDKARQTGPARLVVLDGWGCASGRLDDLVDVRVLVRAPEAIRRRRQVQRGDNAYGDVEAWHHANGAIERWLFDVACPPSAFDLVIDNAES